MKTIKHFIIIGMALFVLISCSKDNEPVVPPTPESNPQENVDDESNTDGTGIDDLHSRQTDRQPSILTTMVKA